MSRRKRKNKRAPVKKGTTKKTQDKLAVINIRPDLRKTAILTAVCLGILFALYLTQSR